MILIHTALYPEAKPIIEYFKLKQFQTQAFKIYKNEDIILVVTGMGKERTLKNLEIVFSDYKIDRAINIGICGCKDEKVEIGSVFCIENHIEDMDNGTLTTVDEPLDDKNKLETLLVDMEAKYFKQVSLKYLHKKDTFIIKVVSDHLNKAIPKKSFVNMLIIGSLVSWRNLVKKG